MKILDIDWSTTGYCMKDVKERNDKGLCAIQDCKNNRHPESKLCVEHYNLLCRSVGGKELKDETT